MYTFLVIAHIGDEEVVGTFSDVDRDLAVEQVKGFEIAQKERADRLGLKVYSAVCIDVNEMQKAIANNTSNRRTL